MAFSLLFPLDLRMIHLFLSLFRSSTPRTLRNGIDSNKLIDSTSRNEKRERGKIVNKIEIVIF